MPSIFRAIVDNRNHESLANRMRRRRGRLIKQLVDKYLQENDTCTIIDIGGTRRYWEALDWPQTLKGRLHFCIVNVSYEECVGDSQFSYVIADATRTLPFDDKIFDICHSNSVVEHVGTWDKKKNYAAEIRRVAKSYFVQTPNYYFPIEPHFFFPLFHFMPKPMQIYLVQNFSLGWYPPLKNIDDAMEAVETKDLLTGKLMQYLFPDSQITKERFLFLVKSIIVFRN